MYKRIIIITFIFCVTTFEMNAQSDISKDPLLFGVLKNYENEISGIKNINIVKDYFSDKDISEIEMNDLYVHLGYNSNAEMVNFITDQNNKLLDLSKRYNLKQYTNEQLKEKFKKCYEENGVSNYVLDECSTSRVNCLWSVTAEAAIMHLSCAGLDLTIFLGIVCHTAALIYQQTGSSNCNIQYNKCKGISEN